MARTPTTVRLSDAEKRILRAAAERRGTTYGRYLREAALEAAVDVLETELLSEDTDAQPSGTRS